MRPRAYAALLESESFADGKYAGRVLEVHSKSPDKDLAELEAVEHSSSPVRIIVARGQTEGRMGRSERLRDRLDAGFRFRRSSRNRRSAAGSASLSADTRGVEFLDTLEVLAHESYDRLLKARKVFQETFIDHADARGSRDRPKGELRRPH